MPGVLRDFDMNDLSQLILPRRQVWIEPVNASGKSDPRMASSYLGNHKQIFVLSDDSSNNQEIIKQALMIYCDFKQRSL